MAFSLKQHGIRVLVRKIRRRLQKPVAGPPVPDREWARLPEGGETVSVEKALNSRCSSDEDGDPRLSHWGMFDRDRRLPATDIDRIVRMSDIRRFTGRPLGLRVDDHELFFLVDPDSAGRERDRLMVESGMHQQAVSLVCAALGVGCLILNLGLNGRPISEREFATVRMRLGPMKPSFGGSSWTAAAPAGERPWRPGNLPDPQRDGGMPLVSAMKTCDLRNSAGAPLSRTALGQVLWAGRGRTPHFYNCTPWGMTIPTWAGRQDISGLHVLGEESVFAYVNSDGRRPTHSLERKGDVDRDLYRRVLEAFEPWTCLLVVSTGETHARGQWEAGYQLLNILVQACALGLSYGSFLPGDERGRLLSSVLSGGRPAAVVGFRGSGRLLHT